MSALFGIKPTQKVAIFIDGPNLYATSKHLGFVLDYRKLRNYFEDNCELVRAFYHTTIREDEEQNTIRPLLDFLDYNGFMVVTRIQRVFTDRQGKERSKGSVHVDMTVDMVDIADRVDHIVLFTGDGEFDRAIDAVQRRGCKVTVVSSRAMVADDLRRQGDVFVELSDVEAVVARTEGTTQIVDETSHFTSRARVA